MTEMEVERPHTFSANKASTSSTSPTDNFVPQSSSYDQSAETSPLIQARRPIARGIVASVPPKEATRMAGRTGASGSSVS